MWTADTLFPGGRSEGRALLTADTRFPSGRSEGRPLLTADTLFPTGSLTTAGYVWGRLYDPTGRGRFPEYMPLSIDPPPPVIPEFEEPPPDTLGKPCTTCLHTPWESLMVPGGQGRKGLSTTARGFNTTLHNRHYRSYISLLI